MSKKKDIDYFKELEELVDISCQSAAYLFQSLKDFQNGIGKEQIKEAHKLEHNGDYKKHELMNSLMKEFITPIEREDIVSIAQQIDNVTDAIEDVMIKMYMFNITRIPKEALEFCEIIIRCADTLKTVMKEFPNFKKPAKLRELMIEVHDRESEGDVFYSRTIRSLYTGTDSPIDLMTWTEIYRRFENCLDAMEDVANDVEMVLMKNS